MRGSATHTMFGVAAVLLLAIKYASAIEKCCKNSEHYNINLEKCEATELPTNFNDTVLDFKDRFYTYASLNDSSICLDRTNSGLLVVITNDDSVDHDDISYCFSTSNLTSGGYFENGSFNILKNIKFNDLDHSLCEEQVLFSAVGNIRVLLGNETETGYTVRLSNASLPAPWNPTENGTAFYRKCCREGEVWISRPGYGYECKSEGNLSQISLDFRDDQFRPYKPAGVKGLPAPLDLSACQQDLYEVPPEEPGKFSILPNGSLLFFPNYVVDSYCVERLLTEDGDQKNLIMECVTEDPEPNLIQPLLYPFFYGAALPFLLATLVVYLALPELRNQQGKLVIGHCLSLFIFFLLMLIVSVNTHIPKGLCIGLGVATHFFYLSSFTWLAVKGLHLMTLWSLSFMHSELNRFWVFAAFGWGLPAAIVIFALTIQFGFPESGLSNPNYGKNYCFLDKIDVTKPLVWYLFLPLGFVLLINIVTFVISATLMCQAGVRARNLAPTNRVLLKSRLWNVVRISFVMGLTWTFDLVSYLDVSQWSVWIVTDILNILTAIYIFYFYICKRRVAEFLYRRYPKTFPCFRQYDKRANTQTCNSGQQRKTSETTTAVTSFTQ